MDTAFCKVMLHQRADLFQSDNILHTSDWLKQSIDDIFCQIHVPGEGVGWEYQ